MPHPMRMGQFLDQSSMVVAVARRTHGAVSRGDSSGHKKSNCLITHLEVTQDHEVGRREAAILALCKGINTWTQASCPKILTAGPTKLENSQEVINLCMFFFFLIWLRGNDFWQVWTDIRMQGRATQRATFREV